MEAQAMWLSQTRRLEALKQAVRSGIYANRRLRTLWTKAAHIRDELFEFWNGIDTAGQQRVHNLTLQGSHGPDATAYSPVTPRNFRHALAALKIDYSHYCFIDVGSGKGRAVLLASRYPFKKVIGIEFAKELHEAALKNLRTWRWKRKCGSVELLWADALEFEFPAEPCLLFIHNPFGPSILSGVLENAQRSIENRPRDLIVVYYQPNFKSVIQAMPNVVPLSDSQYYNYAAYQFRALR